MENINKQTIFGVTIEKNFQKPYINCVKKLLRKSEF